MRVGSTAQAPSLLSICNHLWMVLGGQGAGSQVLAFPGGTF